MRFGTDPLFRRSALGTSIEMLLQVDSIGVAQGEVERGRAERKSLVVFDHADTSDDSS